MEERFGILKHVLNLSVNQGVFPKNMKIACVTTVFKRDDEYLLTNYRSISVFPCFLNILKRIIYNRNYDLWAENNILYEKQFGFQSAHSIEHAILQLSNGITNSFNEKQFTLRFS